MKNLLRQHNSPFQRDPSFPYICWNILQKREVNVNRQASFRTSGREHKDIAKQMFDVTPALSEMISQWEKNPKAKPSTSTKKKVIALLNKRKLVTKEV